MSSPAGDPWATRPGSAEDAVDTALLGKPRDPAPGQQLGSYELLEPLGRGGMGMIYRARHVRLKKEFALKVLSPRFAGDRNAQRRFEREIEALGRLEHLHLVRASDAGIENGIPFVVMELLDGMDLARVTENRGPWPIAEACEAARQAALGLQHTHERGLVHRDIKPSNLWLTSAGIVKVLDLGLARMGPARGNGSPMTRAGMWMGTPDYIAPEQILDSHTTDIRADLYSLGCTLFQLLCGEPPFSAASHPELRDKNDAHLREKPPDIRQRRPEVPGKLAAVLNKLLAKQPQDRYATPAEAAAALAPFARNACLQTLLAPGKPPGKPAGKPAGKAAIDAIAPTERARSTGRTKKVRGVRSQQKQSVWVLVSVAVLAAVGGTVLVPILSSRKSAQTPPASSPPAPKQPEAVVRRPAPEPALRIEPIRQPIPAPQPGPAPRSGPVPPPGPGPYPEPGPRPAGMGPYPGPPPRPPMGPGGPRPFR